MKPYILLILFASLFMGACNLQQEIDLELPEYDAEYVVESYLQVGQPFFLTLTESQPYFDDVTISYLKGADVTIEHKGEIFTLAEQTFRLDDPTLGAIGVDTGTLNILRPILGDTVTFYLNINLVPESYNEDFDLNITLPNGEALSAKTQILEPIPFDSLVFQQAANDTLSLLLSFFTDDGSQANFYRRVLEVREDQVISGSGDEEVTMRVTSVEQDFIADDVVFNGQPFAFGTGFDFAIGDTVINTLYHMTFDHYRFVETRDAAIAASLSPFGQPAVIYSNIKGGLGIFAGISLDRQVTVREE
ncbi:MAG: DUF4249 domain-containing protein [Bacteroidota bacterium]